MKKLVITNFKGGVGKTTIAASLAVDLSTRLGKKVLLVDFDPQCNLSEYFLADVDERGTFMDILRGSTELPLSEINSKLDILIGGLELEMFANVVTNDSKLKLNPGSQLKKILNLLKDRYEYCIIDTRPAIDLTVSNALIAADYVLVPVQPTARSLKGLKQSTSLIEEIQEENNPDLKIIGLVLNEFVQKNVSAKFVGNELESYKDKILNTRIRKAEAVIHSENSCINIFELQGNPPIKQDFRDLTDEILNIIEK